MQNLDALNALNKLCELGKKQKDIKIGDLIITLSTLNTGDETEVFISCSELQGNAYFNTLKLQTLKYAIKAVNNQKLDNYNDIEDNVEKQKNKNDTLQKISEILKNFDDKIITFLYTEWAKLSKESEDELASKGLITE
jgi:hypothetical protein